MSDFERQVDEARAGLASFPKGLKVWATAPETYEMWYLNGKQTYTERFLALKAPKEMLGGFVAGYDAAFLAVAGACLTVPVIGPALGFLVEVAGSWIKDCHMDPDGGITLFAARHYVGTNAAGCDFTAWPIPGVPPEAWNPVVDGAIRLAGSLPKGTGNQGGGGGGAVTPLMEHDDLLLTPVRTLIGELGQPAPLIGRTPQGDPAP